MNPAIVVIAYNRPLSLRRLLASVEGASYPNNEEIALCICIDFQDSEANQEVLRVAAEFQWPYGRKEIIHQNRNLGLKVHVLTCGDLVERFGSIVMLEDDLYVSPAYYEYTCKALDFYAKDDRIGGISLYNHRINFATKVPFQPLLDGTDVYFLQIASSWGQAWTVRQWKKFREWFVDNPVVNQSVPIPAYVIGWPDKSWLKHYIHYLAATNRFFVYPREALCTNYGDEGENTNRAKTFFQVPLQSVRRKSYLWRFVSIVDALGKYDAYFDLLPEIITKYNPRFAGIKFINNISGLKPEALWQGDCMLIKGNIPKALQTYNMALKPMEMNVLFDLKGKGISLVSLESKINLRGNSAVERVNLFEYQYGSIQPKRKIQNLFDTLLTKIFYAN